MIEQQPSIARQHGRYFSEVFRSWAPLASESVISEARRFSPSEASA